jgi:cyclophilin family peptidyl-prolyl cis-trans isomerase
MKRPVLMLLAALVALPMSAAGLPVRTHEFLSETYTIDKKYRSMEGPGSTTSFTVGDGGPPELLWITGVKTEMVAADGVTPQLPEFMCHVNVDLDAARHAALFNMRRPVATRLITLSQGITDTRVPDGFGFPISSNEPLVVYTQVLNHNIENPQNMKVRHRVTFEYIRDRDLREPIKPLMNLGASGTVILPAGPLSVTGAATPAAADTSNAHGPSCLIAARAPNAAGMGGDYVDPKGRKLTGHWVVPPGRQTNHSDVSWFMGLPFDTKLHYAAVHLHPFAESLELRDVTANKSMFLAKAKNPKGKVGLDHVDTFLSKEGLQFHRDHEYQLISVYNNPTNETHDSMASMFFGFADREFRKPTADDLAARTADLDDHSTSTAAFLHTTYGTIPVQLLRELAPKSARQFARLVRAGMLQGAKVTKLEKDGEATVITFAAPMTRERRRMISQLPPEALAVPHDGATLSICPRDGEPDLSFQLVVGRAASRDRRCTVFATVGAQSLAIRQITGTPRDEKGVPIQPIEITGGEVVEVTSVAQSTM